MRRSHLEDRN